MNLTFKPKATIGEIVRIVGTDCIQTSAGFRITHLFSNRDYYVHDVTVTTSLKTGEVKYEYLIGSKHAKGTKGWVGHDDIELKVEGGN